MEGADGNADNSSLSPLPLRRNHYTASLNNASRTGGALCR